MSNQSVSSGIKITLMKSRSGRLPLHRATLDAMGLKRLGQSVVLPKNKATQGMLKLINYLVRIEGE